MARDILVVIASRTPDPSVSAAAELAANAQADLIIGFDAANISFTDLSVQMSHCVDLATSRGARTSTMLLNVDDSIAIERTVVNHGIDLVVWDCSDTGATTPRV